VNEPADRRAVMVALIRAARELGWTIERTESFDWRVTIELSPPLATSRLERNRWPHEPEEGPEEHAALTELPRQSGRPRHGA
jgi:hypothetical protein